MTPDSLRALIAFAIGDSEPGRRADAVFAAIRDAGLAIVPKEATPTMMLAGWDVIDKTTFRRAFYDTAIPRSFIEPVSRAMLSAGDLLGERGS